MRQKMLPQCNCFMMHFKLGSDWGGRCIRYLQNRCPGPDWSQSWCLADLLGPVRSIQQEIFYLAMLDFILYALNSHTFTTCHMWTICVAVLALWVILTLLSKIHCIYSSFGKPVFAPWFFHFLPDDQRQRTKGKKSKCHHDLSHQHCDWLLCFWDDRLLMCLLMHSLTYNYTSRFM